jgi:catechol 2,3-dioxygenase-like lactoylglutathione lyase family enzyme
MLGNVDATAMLAVRDVEAARSFYADVLGFELSEEEMGGILSFRSGTTPVALYESEEAGTNHANALAWSVDDAFDETVSALRDRGVTFERYDLPGMTLEGDVHVAEGFKGVWFKDPDGNILHVNGR